MDEWNSHLEIFTANHRQFLVVVGRSRISDLNDFDVACLQIGQPAALLLFETRHRVAVLLDRIVGYVTARAELAIRHRRMRSAPKT